MNVFGSSLCLFGLLVLVKGESIDGCPPADPNCHPSCIEYTSDHCRYCRCTSSNSGFSDQSTSNFGTSDWSSGMSTDQSWDNSISGGDWSSKVNSNSDVWGNGATGSGSHSENEANVKYVIVEKTPDTYVEESSVLPRPFMGGGPMAAPMAVPMAAHMSLPSSPFSSASHMSSELLPGSYSASNTEYSSSSVIHVPLVAPGIPRYCVRCPILNCPGTCERVDEYGCRSCPCAPSRYQTMPINRDCSKKHEQRCNAIETCKKICKDGFTVGEKDSSGCQTCSCIKYEVRATAKPQGKECPATLSCMLKCKTGYVLGNKMANGCPSCKCLPKSASENHQSSNSNSNKNNYNTNYKGNTNNGWSSGKGNSNGNTNGGFNGGSSTGSGDMYSGVSNGIGDGKCKPPMCLDGHMSVGEAMEMGESSAGTGVMDGGSYSGMASGMTSSGGSTDSGNCYPMCASGSGGSMGSGSSGSNTGMTSGGMGSSSGCSGPFCASMGGGGGMMGGGGGGMMGGGGGMMGGSGGKPFSPFAAAMSGGGPGMGMSGGGMGGMSNQPGSQSAVQNAAYNKDCFGAECSAKNGMQHKDCAQLVHCMMTCDNYMLGELDSAGCQTCSCN